MKPSVHVPVMPEEVRHWLAPTAGKTFVDGTLGGGGHTRMLAKAVGDTGCVVALDRDPEAVLRAETLLQGLPVILAHRSYADIPEVLAEAALGKVDGVLLDLGLSSDQLADANRGFSFQVDGPLDLRFDPHVGGPASQLLQRISASHLADLIYQFGEERFSRRIARAICERRRTRPIRTTRELAELVRACIPVAARNQPIDPATRTFQALRIAVNEELKALQIAMQRLPDVLNPGGRIVVISFHSLEDRIVKHAFRADPRLEPLTRKPILPAEAEIRKNPRSRSAKLRAAEYTRQHA